MAQMWSAPDANIFQRIMCCLVFIAIIALGGFCVNDTLSSHKKAESSLSWPHTEATLVDGAEVVHYQTSRNVLASILSAYSDLDISYQYAVRGKTYTGRTASLEKTVDAGAFIKQHSVGDKVAVYYNPRKPSESVLFPGAQQEQFFLYLGVSGVLVACGFFPFVNALSGWIAYDMQIAKMKPKTTKKKTKKK